MCLRINGFTRTRVCAISVCPLAEWCYALVDIDTSCGIPSLIGGHTTPVVPSILLSDYDMSRNCTLSSLRILPYNELACTIQPAD